MKRDHEQAREFIKDMDKSHTELLMELKEVKTRNRALEGAIHRVREVLRISTFNRNLSVIHKIMEGVKDERKIKADDNENMHKNPLEAK